MAILHKPYELSQEADNDLVEILDYSVDQF